MKNKILYIVTVFLVMLSYQSAISQVTIRPGARSGISISDISDLDGDSRISFYAGGFVTFKLAKWYSLQPEINYSQQGTRAQHTFYGDSGSFDPSLPGYTTYSDTWKLNYLGLTITNKFHIIPKFSIEVGPYLDFMVSEKNIDIKNEADTGITFGLSYELYNGLGVEARARIGFVDIFDDYTTDDNFNGTEYNLLNSAFQIGLTYTFNPTKK